MQGERITSKQNQRVKDAVKLRDHRRRASAGQFLIEGARELLHALDAGIALDEAFVCPELISTSIALQAAERVQQTEAVVCEVTPEVYEKLSFGERAEGVLSVARTPRKTLADLNVPAGSLVAVLEQVEKPGNIGAMLRSADGAGVAALVVADPQTDLYNPNAVRASMGAIFTVPVCTATSAETLAWLRAGGYRIFATWPGGGQTYTQADYRGSAAIVLGSEAHGLTSTWQADDIQAIYLPMRGQSDSLNVSATASVLFYEALRQREL